MRSFLAGLFLVLSSLSAGASRPIDVVFDLDWTLLLSTDEAKARADGRLIFRHGEHWYRLTDHALEVLRAIHENPRYRVSYFSGGAVDRNRAVVAWIYELLNANRAERPFVPHRVLSFDDLTKRPGVPEAARFTERHGKDLTRVGADLALPRAVLIDDAGAFAEPGQEKNMLWLERSFNDRPVFPFTGAPDKYDPMDAREWLTERHKLVWAFDLLEESREAAERSGTELRDELDRRMSEALARARAQGFYRNLTPEAEARIQRGFERLGFMAAPTSRQAVGASLCSKLWY